MDINYGFENEKFYVDFKACSRIAGNMREEGNIRAKELYEKYNGNLLLGFSSGVDSQAMYLSFAEQGLPVKTVFKYMPGFNDNELTNVKFLDKKYGITTEIIDVDVMSLKDSLEEEELDTGIQIYSLLWKHFITLLPKDSNFVQMAHDPYVHFSNKNKSRLYFVSYNGPDVSKHRAYQLIKNDRSGDYIFFGHTPEFLYSILSDEVFKSAMNSIEYFINNGLTKNNLALDTLDRWDYYIKPLIYGRHWDNTLEFFPKFVGFANIPFAQRDMTFFEKHNRLSFFKYHSTYEYYNFLRFLGQTNGEVKRVYQSWHTTDPRLNKN
jgi:hypothetical protein